MLNNIKEHSFDSSLKRLEILQTISSGHELRKLGKIVQSTNQLLFIPYSTLGFHMSVHDRDKNHPQARIHLGIPRGKGLFKIYPPGLDVGERTGQIDIPSFSQIRGILRLPPEPAGCKVVGLLNADALWQQSPGLKPSEVSSRLKLNIALGSPISNSIGIEYFFIEPGNITQLMDWYYDRASTYEGIELTAEVFKAFVPWLAIVTVQDAGSRFH